MSWDYFNNVQTSVATQPYAAPWIYNPPFYQYFGLWNHIATIAGPVTRTGNTPLQEIYRVPRTRQNPQGLAAFYGVRGVGTMVTPTYLKA